MTPPAFLGQFGNPGHISAGIDDMSRDSVLARCARALASAALSINPGCQNLGHFIAVCEDSS